MPQPNAFSDRIGQSHPTVVSHFRKLRFRPFDDSVAVLESFA